MTASSSVLQSLEVRVQNSTTPAEQAAAMLEWAWVGWCYNPDVAWQRAHQARAIAYAEAETGYAAWTLVADSLLAVAHLLLRMNRGDEITSEIEDAAMIYAYADHSYGLLRCQYVRALKSMAHFDDEAAYHSLHTALADPVLSEYPLLVSQMQALIGSIFCRMEDGESAAIFFEAAQHAARQAGNPLAEGQVLGAWVQGVLNQTDAALLLHRAMQALHLQRAEQDWYSQYYTTQSVIRAHLKRHDIASARRYLDAYAMMAHHIHRLLPPYQGLLLQAEMEFRDGHLEQADVYINMAALHLPRIRDPREVIALRQLAAQIYHAQENYEWALMHTHEAALIQQRLLADSQRRRVQTLRQPHVAGILQRAVERKKDEVEQLDTRVRALTRLLQMYDEVSSNLNVSYVTTLSLDAAIRLSGADGGYIALFENEGATVHAMMGAYPHRDLALADELRLSLNQRQLIVLRGSQIPLGGLPALPAARVRVLVPLHISDRLVGLLVVETANSQRFTANVHDLLEKMKGFIAIALDNALLYEQLAAQNRELAASLQQVTRLESFKSDMIRLASHDLKQPLTIMRLYLSMIQATGASNLTDTQLNYLNAMTASIRAMDRLITDILSLERIEQMGLNPPDTTFDLVEACREVVEYMGVQAQEKQQRYAFSTELERAVVRGDRTQLAEAVNNFLSNAIKYTPEGGSIQARLYRIQARVYLEVQDNGFGIAAQDQARLFEPSYRVQNEQTQGISGTGWGLYLVKKIVEAHQGTVFFTSAPGAGSTFGFHLPLADG